MLGSREAEVSEVLQSSNEGLNCSRRQRCATFSNSVAADQCIILDWTRILEEFPVLTRAFIFNNLPPHEPQLNDTLFVNFYDEAISILCGFCMVPTPEELLITDINALRAAHYIAFELRGVLYKALGEGFLT